MERPILSARGAAGYLEALDNVLLLTHVRPDGDTIGSAAALCRALRDCGQTAYLLPNPEITATYAPYAAPYWAPEGWQAEHIVSVDIADASLLPENAQSYRDRIELAIDHHPSQTFFARNTCLEADSAACGECTDKAPLAEKTTVSERAPLAGKAPAAGNAPAGASISICSAKRKSCTS